MIEYACTCDDLPPHSHIGEQIVLQHWDGRRTSVPAASLAGTWSGDWAEVERIPPSIRIWVDWKAVARSLSLSAGRRRDMREQA